MNMDENYADALANEPEPGTADNPCDECGGQGDCPDCPYHDYWG